MKKYRVGTWTLGLVLIAIGIAGIVSIFKGIDSFLLLSFWWPLIFILLGGEILLFLYRKKREDTTFSYDLFSLFVIGCFAFFGLMMFSLTQTGILKEVQAVVGGEKKVVSLKNYEEPLEGIEKIVFYTEEPLHIETTNEKKVSIFGSVQTLNRPSYLQSLKNTDFVEIKREATTLFVHITQLPTPAFNYNMNESYLIALLPSNMKVTVNSKSNDLEVALNEPTKDWNIEGANSLTMYARHQQGMIDAFLYSEVLDGNVTWETVQTNEQGTHGTIRLGEGSSVVKVKNTHQFSVFVN